MDTMKTTLEYGKRYRILKMNQEVVEGEHIQTRGNDGDYPTFAFPDGSQLGTHISRVLGEVSDDAPPHGIQIFGRQAGGELVYEDDDLNKRILPG